MNCHWIQSNMTSYWDSSLPSLQLNAIGKHLEACEQCREWYLEVQELERIWRDPDLPALEEGLTESIMADIRSRPAPYRRRARFTPMVKMALASSCALLLFMYNGGALFDAAASRMGMYNGHLAQSITHLFQLLSSNP